MNSPYWFEVAVVSTLVGIGGIIFAPFALGVPIWQRLLKLAIGIGGAVTISMLAGRGWFFATMGLILGVVIVVHAWWLPKQGVNGWTAEPRNRYDALRRSKRRMRASR